MILSDGDIKERLDAGDLAIEPLDNPELQIQPASVDLRLGNEFIEFEGSNIPCIHPYNAEEGQNYTREDQASLDDFATEGLVIQEDDGKNEKYIETGDEYILQPKEFVLGSTYERVDIPADLVARVEGRSSLGRLAIVVHATAGFVDPGYSGKITLELSNLGNTAVALRPGEMRVSQLVFNELKTAAERPYGEERGSKYQGQKGPTASKIQNDDEWQRQAYEEKNLGHLDSD